jgi:RNA polymerase sigma factor (sigma-70 family)
MAHHTDHELLAEFVKNGSESAFAALVARYVNLVYSTALRHTNSPHQAEEITQTVFILLARKAGSISSKAVLSGWLYQAARLTAANYRRDNQRRQQREQQAIMESALNVPADEPWKLIAPILDEAMNALGITDRDAVLLRYFENKPLAEVGAALGVSEAAAEKRVSRALERLHAMLNRQGVALGATAIAGAITANAVQAAPAALAATITAAGLTATSLTSATVVMTTLQKIAITAVLAATIGGGIYAGKQASDAHKEVRELQAQQAPLVKQIRQLQSSLTDATNRLTDLTAENSELKSGKDKMEVLKLRGEVAAMRTQLASLQSGRLETTNGVGETLHVRTFRIIPRAFLEKADSALGHPVNSTPTQITADYFASKGIKLEPPKSVYLNTSNALLVARATDPELNAIESLLAESTPAQINIKARFIEIPRQGFVMPSAIPGMKDNKTPGVSGILGPAQLRVICKALQQREGVNLLTESQVLTLSGRQCQIRTGDDAGPEQPASSGAIVDLIPSLSADGYTIKLKAAVSAPETLNGEVNMYDHQTLLLSTTEKTKPDSQLIVLLTATLVDPVGNLVHADDELPFAQSGAPPQN